MDNKRDSDALVIGGGPGGYVAAIRLAQLGRDVTLVERDRVGGVCLNHGCIPSKALIHAATLFERAGNGAEIGVLAKPTLDFKRLQAWKNDVVEKLTGGVRQLLKANGVKVVAGSASFAGPRLVEIASKEGTSRVEAKSVILATGARPIELPGLRFDGKRVVTAKEALAFEAVPTRLLVVGGGAIGVELGTAYAMLGAKVTIVEMMDQLLPGVDVEAVRVVARGLKRRGVDVLLKSKVVGVGDGLLVRVGTADAERIVQADRVLVSVGMRPSSDGIGLDRAGIHVDAKGHVAVNERMETNVAGVFAIGDLVGPPYLAHRASKQGEIAAEASSGRASAFDVAAMPAAVFSDPEVATVGMSESVAVQGGHAARSAKFPLGANGRALSLGETEGFAKVVYDEKTKQLLGATIVGPEASDLVGEVAVAIEMGAEVGDVGLTVHTHPSLSEALMEAAKAALGEAIHVVNR